MKNTKTESLHSLATIFSNEKMKADFRNRYNTDEEFIIIAINGNLIKDEALDYIEKIAPICYKIGNKVFLKCEETKDTIDLIGDELDYNHMIELMDMTTEMKTGDSYSFYVSSLSNFDLASKDEMIEVKNFLDSLK